MVEFGSYLFLGATAFVAATLLPFYSEVVLVAMLMRDADPGWVFVAATVGNTLGAVVNWYIGRFLLRFEDRSWFPFQPHKVHRAQRWFQRYGKWSLLMAWLPVGGDALTFIAGVMRVPLGIFLVLTAFGKGARYAVVIALTLGMI
ncbi:MAG TPA: YqaA family protein [Arenicellales bacterium]|nr:YqaA family protein [Arenicellales bacterium]